MTFSKILYQGGFSFYIHSYQSADKCSFQSSYISLQIGRYSYCLFWKWRRERNFDLYTLKFAGTHGSSCCSQTTLCKSAQRRYVKYVQGHSFKKDSMTWRKVPYLPTSGKVSYVPSHLQGCLPVPPGHRLTVGYLTLRYSTTVKILRWAFETIKYMIFCSLKLLHSYASKSCIIVHRS